MARFYGLVLVALLGGHAAIAGAAVAPCPNAQYRTGPSANLPECRAYEMVAPAEKLGGFIQPGNVLDRNHVLYSATASLIVPDFPPTDGVARYLGIRSATAWGIRSATALPFAVIAGYSEDFGRETFETQYSGVPGDTDNFPGPAGENGVGQLDVYSKGPNGIELASTGSIASNGAFPAGYAGQSADGTHVVFGTEESLEPADAGRISGPQLYERFGGTTRVVSLDDNGDPISAGGAILGGYGLSGVPGLEGNAWGGIDHAVSDDGSRIFFEAPCPGGFQEVGFCPEPEPGEPTQLYVRENGTDTTHVSASECTRVAPACESVGAARFDGAAADGSRVYFNTAAQLIDADEDKLLDLYTYDLETDELRGVSVGQQGTVGCSAEVVGGLCGVTAVSEDGGRAYFVAAGTLDSSGVVGEKNLYVYDADAETVDLVATLAAADSIAKYKLAGLSRQDTVAASLTHDGSRFVFQTKASLVPGDLESVDVYLYDANSEELACVSCVAGAGADIGETMLTRHYTAFNIPPGAAENHNQFLSGDGESVVFETDRQLLPGDVNDSRDAYLWRNGQLSLISTGTFPANASVMGISTDGGDIFFTTQQRLVGADVDNDGDIYDARVDGGVTADHPIALLPCGGEGCKGAASPPPGFTGPGTSAFSAPPEANPTRPRCAKGKVKRKGRCVRKRGKAGKHSKSNQNRRVSR